MASLRKSAAPSRRGSVLSRPFAQGANRAARDERAIQRHIDRRDKANGAKEPQRAMQAGARRYPTSLPKQQGPVWTPLNPADKPAKAVAKFGHDTPMKRPAQPEEIAPAFVFMAAPSCSSYITGEVLPIIGGYSGG